VLKWIVDRVRGRATDVAESPFGYSPRYQDLNWSGLNFPADKFAKIMDIDRKEAEAEAKDQEELFNRFGDRLPEEIEQQRVAVLKRLESIPDVWRIG
jgi:phosphoenolpyruvate carboxykinase (GTP)